MKSVNTIVKNQQHTVVFNKVRMKQNEYLNIDYTNLKGHEFKALF